ncbi:MAG: hypothetical protein NTW08_03875 [Gammaproteobacteria bacterium]|nr:hypothetical protein [Gammaproteobacteria bacterium]
MPSKIPEQYHPELDPIRAFYIPRTKFGREQCLAGALYQYREEIVERVVMRMHQSTTQDALFDGYYAAAEQLGYGVRKTSEHPDFMPDASQKAALTQAFMEDYTPEHLCGYAVWYIQKSIAGKAPHEINTWINQFLHQGTNFQPGDKEKTYFSADSQQPMLLEKEIKRQVLLQISAPQNNQQQAVMGTVVGAEPDEASVGEHIGDQLSPLENQPDKLIAFIKHIKLDNAKTIDELKSYFVAIFHNEEENPTKFNFSAYSELLSKIVKHKSEIPLLDKLLIEGYFKYYLSEEHANPVFFYMHLLGSYLKHYPEKDFIRDLLSQAIRQGKSSHIDASYIPREGNLIDAQGNTLLHDTLVSNDFNSCKLFCSKLDMMLFLRLCQTKNRAELTPITQAIQEQKWNALAAIFKHGLEVGKADLLSIDQLRIALRGALNDKQLAAIPVFVSSGVLKKPSNEPWFQSTHCTDGYNEVKRSFVTCLNQTPANIASLTEADYQNWVLPLFELYPQLFSNKCYDKGIMSAAIHLNNQAAKHYLKQHRNLTEYENLMMTAGVDTPLDALAKQQKWHEVLEVIKQFPTDPDGKKGYNKIFMTALSQHQNEVVSQLFLTPAIKHALTEIHDQDNNNACHLLALDLKGTFHADIRRRLITRDICAPLWTKANADGITPLGLALEQRNWPLLAELFEVKLERKSRGIRGILKTDAQIKITGYDKEGNNLCHMLFKDPPPPVEMIDKLRLSTDPFYNALWAERNHHGHLPVQVALEQKKLSDDCLAELVFMSLKHMNKADFKNVPPAVLKIVAQKVDSAGNNLLHINYKLFEAIDNPEISRALLQHTNNAGITPFQIALRRSDREHVALMMQSNLVSIQQVKIAYSEVIALAKDKHHSPMLAVIVLEMGRPFYNFVPPKMDDKVLQAFLKIYDSPSAKHCLAELDNILELMVFDLLFQNQNGFYALPAMRQFLVKASAKGKNNPTFFSQAEGAAIKEIADLIDTCAKERNPTFKMAQP